MEIVVLLLLSTAELGLLILQLWLTSPKGTRSLCELAKAIPRSGKGCTLTVPVHSPRFTQEQKRTRTRSMRR
eukprot:2219309-Pyramimonas_sp.AAC.1